MAKVHRRTTARAASVRGEAPQYLPTSLGKSRGRVPRAGPVKVHFCQRDGPPKQHILIATAAGQGCFVHRSCLSRLFVSLSLSLPRRDYTIPCGVSGRNLPVSKPQQGATEAESVWHCNPPHQTTPSQQLHALSLALSPSFSSQPRRVSDEHTDHS